MKKILIILGIFFFFLYSWFTLTITLPQAKNYQGEKIFSWPDDMANYFFISQFIQTSNFIKTEPLNLVLENIIHPRSANVVYGNIAPMSFLGMLFLYGWLGKIVGGEGILFLTPFFSVMGVFFFYGLIKNIFNQKIAFFSSLLLFTLASYWYYSNLVMLHTALFISLIITGFYFYIKQNKEKIVFSFLSGLFLGLAITARALEFPWIGFLIIIPFLFYRRRVGFTQIIIFLISLSFPFLFTLYYNQLIYHEFFTVGYLKMNSLPDLMERLPNEFRVKATSKFFSYLKFLFIPFGFDLKMIFFNLKRYLLEFLYPYYLFFLFGIFLWIVNLFQGKITKKEFVYCLTSLVLACWLILYYGSWKFVDPMVLKYNIISSSYIRYWLPLNILILPFIAYFLSFILKIKISKFLIFSLVALIIFGLTLFSFFLVYLSPMDGLFKQRKIIETYYLQAKRVDELVEKNVIIISDRADKVFFPRYRVIMFNLDYSIFSPLSKVINHLPLYYFTLMTDKDINYINEKKIKSLKLKFVEPKVIDKEFRLFKLIRF